MIHYTAMQSAAAAALTLCNPEAQVSAHYLITEDGEVLSLVPEAMRAWHAGAGSWGAVSDVNSRSIGIELANTGFTPFAAAQMDALVALLKAIKLRWGIRPERVIGHSDMAPGRKTDPGVRFDWRRLALEGVSVWPFATLDITTTMPLDTGDLQRFYAAMAAFGYTATSDPDLLLRTLRIRFRPHYDGAPDATDLAIITDLAKRFPVDVNAARA